MNKIPAASENLRRYAAQKTSQRFPTEAREIADSHIA